MKSNKALVLLMLLTMVVPILAGCGGEEATPTAAPTEEATEAPTEAPTEEATEAPTEEAPPVSEGASMATVAIGGDPANLGPFVGMSYGRINVLNTMYAYLFYNNPETGSLDPYLAQSIENTAERTYVVTLFDYITDSAGNHITAADVAFSYNTAMEANVYRPLGDGESVTATGDYTV